VFAGSAPTIANVYDETRHGWVARGQVPDDGSVSAPFVAVFLGDINADADLPQPTPDHSDILEGTVSVAVQLHLIDVDSEEAMTAAMYLMRAIRNACSTLNDPKNVASRRALGIELRPAVSVRAGRPRNEMGESICAGALVFPYPVVETMVLP
jgi:hypothetical protein